MNCRSLVELVPNIDTDQILLFVLLDHLWVLFPDVVMVIASEVAVDVVKHAFITKFNDISADVSPFCIRCLHSLCIRLWCSQCLDEWSNNVKASKRQE